MSPVISQTEAKPRHRSLRNWRSKRENKKRSTTPPQKEEAAAHPNDNREQPDKTRLT